MKYLLVFVTIWSLSSTPDGSWTYKEYDWTDSEQACYNRAEEKIVAANEVKSSQFLNRTFQFYPSMNLIETQFKCYDEKQVEEYQNGNR